MALEAVPLLSEDSLLSWGLEGTFKSVASGSTWRSFGRAIEFDDLGPTHATYRDAIAGAGREAHQTGFEGTSYGPKTYGPWQVVDPKPLALSWGQEVSPPAQIGSTGFYRHTATPTTNGQLPSMSVQMLDLKGTTVVDGTTYLGVIQPDLAIRGEEGGEDGSGGRIMYSPTLLGHDDDTGVAKKGVTLPTVEPYRKSHAHLQFYDDADFRIHTWETSLSNNATPTHYHRAEDNDKPHESPVEGITYDLAMEIFADGHEDATNAKIIRDLLRDKVTGQGVLKYARTLDEDEWTINLTDIQLKDARKVRRRGKIRYAVDAQVRATNFEWVDDQSTRFLPA